MAAANLPLSVLLGLVDKFTGPLGGVTSKLDAFATKAGKVGKAMSIGITAPTTAFLGLAVHTAAEFEKAMGQVAAATGSSRDELVDLQKVVQKIGESPPFNARQVAGAAAALAREGKTAAEIIGLLPNVSNLAAANAVDLSQAVEIVTDTLDAFNLKAVDSTKVVDKLSAVASKSGGLAHLVDSLNGITPAAQAVGASLDDTLTVLVALNDTGAEGARGSQALQAAFVKLSAGAAATQAGLAKFNLRKGDIFTAAGKLRPLSEILGELGDRGATAGDYIEIFGAKAGPALANVAAKGTRGLRALGEELDRSGGEAARRAGLATEGAGYSFERLAGSFEKLQLAIASSGLLQWVGQIVDVFSGWISTLAETNPELLKLATVALLVAATIGPLILIAGQIASAIAAISAVIEIATPLIAVFNAVLAANPFVLVVLGIAALITGIYLLWKHWDKVMGFLRAAWELWTWPIRTFVSWILDAFPMLDRIIPDWIKNLIHGKTFKTPGSGPEVGTAKVATATGAGGATKTEAKVAVDFQNVPRGVNVQKDGRGSAPVDLSVGYAMAGG